MPKPKSTSASKSRSSAATKINLEHSKNEDAMKLLVAEMRQKEQQVYKGGGEKRMAKLHAKGKMTARERIDALLDPRKPVFEIGTLVGDGMYAEHGGCPSGGVVVVLGYIKGRLCVVVANDATVKAGAWFPITGKKNLRAQEIAQRHHVLHGHPPNLRHHGQLRGRRSLPAHHVRRGADRGRNGVDFPGRSVSG
jgi:hypothetical protein